MEKNFLALRNSLCFIIIFLFLGTAISNHIFRNSWLISISWLIQYKEKETILWLVFTNKFWSYFVKTNKNFLSSFAQISRNILVVLDSHI